MRSRACMMLLAALAAGACQRKGDDSHIRAIVDEGDKHAFGFLALHNDLGEGATSGAENAGREYAEDLARDMTHYALVECLETAQANAATWLDFLEDRSKAGEFYLDKDRKLAISSTATGELDGTGPCRVVNKRLATLPVILKALGAPFEPGKVPTKDSYRLAQAFYLSVRGSYDPAGREVEKLQILPLLSMLKAHTGAPKVNGDAVVEDLFAMDADFNPCVQDTSKGKLKGDAQTWRRENFTCVPGPNGKSNYRPGATFTYDAVRDMVGHEVDALHEQIYAQGGGLTLTEGPETNRAALFDALTDTTKPLAASLLTVEYGSEYDVAPLFQETELESLTLTAGNYSPRYIVVYCGGKPMPVQKIPVRPAGLKKATGLAVGIPKPGTVPAAKPGVVPGGLPKPGTTPAPGTTPGTLTPAQQAANAAAIAKWKQDMQNYEKMREKIGGKYLEAPDQALLTQAQNGQLKPMTNRPGASQFTGFEGTGGSQVFVNKASGETFVYRPAQLEGANGAAGEKVTLWSNGPHTGKLDANGSLGKDYVGMYLAERKDQTVLGVHNGAKGNIEFGLKCANGDCTVPCTKENQAAYAKLQAAAGSETDPLKKETLLAETATVNKLSGGCLGKTGAKALLLQEEECPAVEPEVEKPETEKPEVEKPEVEKPEVEKPEVTPPNPLDETKTPEEAKKPEPSPLGTAPEKNEELKDNFINNQPELKEAAELDANKIMAEPQAPNTPAETPPPAETPQPVEAPPPAETPQPVESSPPAASPTDE